MFRYETGIGAGRWCAGNWGTVHSYDPRPWGGLLQKRTPCKESWTWGTEQRKWDQTRKNSCTYWTNMYHVPSVHQTSQLPGTPQYGTEETSTHTKLTWQLQNLVWSGDAWAKLSQWSCCAQDSVYQSSLMPPHWWVPYEVWNASASFLSHKCIFIWMSQLHLTSPRMLSWKLGWTDLFSLLVSSLVFATDLFFCLSQGIFIICSLFLG